MSGVSDLDIFSKKKHISLIKTLKLIGYDEWLFDLDIFSKKKNISFKMIGYDEWGL